MCLCPACIGHQHSLATLKGIPKTHMVTKKLHAALHSSYLCPTCNGHQHSWDNLNGIPNTYMVTKKCFVAHSYNLQCYELFVISYPNTTPSNAQNIKLTTNSQELNKYVLDQYVSITHRVVAFWKIAHSCVSVGVCRCPLSVSMLLSTLEGPTGAVVYLRNTIVYRDDVSGRHNELTFFGSLA